jgi:adenylate kinase
MKLKKYNPRVILMMGAPGSGKGTQAARLTSLLGIRSLSTGEIMRAAAREDSPEGRRLAATLKSGVLVDDQTICEAIVARLRQELRTGGVILDGFPRTVEQARFLDTVLASMNLPGPTVLHIEVSPESLLTRLTARRQCALCGQIYNLNSCRSAAGSMCEKDGGELVQRADDCEETILRRFAQYEDRTAPVLSYYRDGDFHSLDGDADPGVVAEAVAAALSLELAAA